MKYCDAVVDLQSGDTGKGKVTHHLVKSKEYDVVMRYNGGSNAGHTIYHEGQKIVTHQVPAGVFYGIKSLIGLGCVVNKEKLLKEIEMLNSFGIKTKDLIFIDKRAHVVTDEHIVEDNAKNVVGTTGQGIGPAYRDKYGRVGKRIEPDTNNNYTLVDSIEFLKDTKILAEGAQGFQLDIDWGDYPYVTSSHCTIGSVILNGVPPQKIRKVYGVIKAYETYVGTKKFTDNSEEFKAIAKLGNEFGATTGRPRQVNWININEVKRAIVVNGVTDLIINKIDVMEELNLFGYIENGQSARCNKEEFISKIEKEFTGINLVWSRTPHGI